MYNRQKAVEYAYFWWNKRNPNFYDFDNLGGDCTNFVSQCLYFGGIEMNYNVHGWFFDDLNFRSPSWTGVEEFFDFSTKNKSGVGVMTQQVDAFQIEVGDVVQLRQNEDRFNHTLFVTDIINHNQNIDIYVTAHTNDAKNKLLWNYYFKEIRFLKVLN